MQLRQLEYFLAVAEEGAFTRAAERLLVAQPSLSAQISRLEGELGGPLFERLPRGVVLTPAGRAFQADARQAVNAAARARRAAREAITAAGGEIELETVLSLAVGLLPASISAFRKLRPGISFGLREYRHRDALERAVASGSGDLAIGPEPAAWDGPVVSLGSEEFVLIFSLDDPAAQGESVRLEALARREWVLYDDTHGLSTFHESACTAAGFLPRGSVRTGQVEAAARLAAAGVGPAMVPANVVPPGLEAKVAHVDPPLLRSLAAYARTEFSSAIDAYVRILLRTTQDLRRSVPG